MASPAEEPNSPGAWVPRAKRTVTTLLLARVQIAGAGDHLGRIRNISDGGALVEAEVPLARGDRLKLFLRSGESLSGTVMWSAPGRGGMKFDEGVEVERLLSTPMIARPGLERQPRAPRFAANCPARLRNAHGALFGTLANVSQSGALLHVEDAAPQGPLTLEVPGLDPQPCMLRWCRDGEAGIAFARPLPFREFAGWLAQPEHRYAQ